MRAVMREAHRDPHGHEQTPTRSRQSRVRGLRPRTFFREAAYERPKGRVSGPSEKLIGGDLLSREVALRVPSAQAGLTSLFGMGRGVSPPL